MDQSEWMPKGSTITAKPYNTEGKGVELHHSVTPFGEDPAAAARSIHRAHRSKGGLWYQFLVHADGTIVDGRGWDRYSPPAKGVTICLLGNFEERAPTPEQKMAVHLLRLDLIDNRGGTDAVHWHRQRAKTACPGRHVVAWIEAGMDNPLAKVSRPAPAPAKAPAKAGGSPASPAGSFTLHLEYPILQRGARGRAVRNVQALLLQLGLGGAGFRMDGVYGNRTADAVTALQRFLKMPATGKVDAATMGMLLWPRD